MKGVPALHILSYKRGASADKAWLAEKWSRAGPQCQVMRPPGIIEKVAGLV